jgi:hypothetical protein
MIDRYGYLTGSLIACATVALAIYTGMLYERYTAPEPCIPNFALKIGDHPFAQMHQEMVDDVEVRVWFEGTADEVEQSGRDFMQKMIDWVPEDGRENALGTIVRGEGFLTADREYYVPKDCYAVDLDNWNGPTLYRR